MSYLLREVGALATLAALRTLAAAEPSTALLPAPVDPWPHAPYADAIELYSGELVPDLTRTIITTTNALRTLIGA